MSYKFMERDDHMFLFIKNDLDSQKALVMLNDIDDFIQNDSRNLNIDLHESDFMDSSGLGIIVYAYKRLRENDRLLMLSGVHGQPKELIENLRINKAIPILDEQLFNNLYNNNGEVSHAV